MARLFNRVFRSSNLFMFTLILSTDFVHNDLLLQVRSDENELSECHEADGHPTGNITSPGYPKNLPATFVECDWHLQGQYGQQIVLTFVTFDLPHPDKHGQCPSAYVTYGKYDHQGRRVVEKRVCGTLAPLPFFSGTSRAWVSLVVTGAASPVVYDMHSGILISYNYVYTEMRENQLLIGLVFLVMFPVICCVPILWSYAKKRKQNKADAYVSQFREHQREQKMKVEKCLSMIELSTLNNTWGQDSMAGGDKSTTSPNRAGLLRSSSSPALSPLSLSLLPLSARGIGSGWSSLRSSVLPGQLASSTPRVVVTPLGPQKQKIQAEMPPEKVGFNKGPHQRRRNRRHHKLAVAFSAPSMGSISELDEIGTERDGEIENEDKDVSERPPGGGDQQQGVLEEDNEDDDVFVD